MPFLITTLSLLGLLFIAAAVTLCVCFFKIFYSPRKKETDEYPTPPGKEYDPYREKMVEWIKEIRKLPHTDVEIKSHDGLTLRGKYYEKEVGAPIEILFHGYKGTSERDLCGGVERCFNLGHNALIVDHRASGRSEGHVITFGAKESLDCLKWVEFVINNINGNAKIILTGISMGAATVMIASSMKLPENVVGILADCGYTSTEAIIKKVLRDMKLPPNILYPFARLSARIFGGFDPNALSPISSMKKCSLPIIFFHGDEDGFVPLCMSEENYTACVSKTKRLVIVKGADHGLAFPKDQEYYCKEAISFFRPITNPESIASEKQGF